MTQPSPQLDYAPARPRQRVRRVWRYVLVAAAILLLIAIVPRAVRRVQLVSWQHQCMSYTAPATHVVYEDDPAAVPKLLAPPLNYSGSLAMGYAFFIPPAYRNLVVSQSVGTPFLHERFTPAGQRRLVAIDLFNTTFLPNKVISFNATVIDPSSAVHGPRPLVTLTRGDGASVTLGPDDTFRVFTGQPDPGNPSHFTIDYVLNGARHTLDGWLKDGGVVTIEARN